MSNSEKSTLHLSESKMWIKCSFNKAHQNELVLLKMACKKSRDFEFHRNLEIMSDLASRVYLDYEPVEGQFLILSIQQDIINESRIKDVSLISDGRYFYSSDASKSDSEVQGEIKKLLKSHSFIFVMLEEDMYVYSPTSMNADREIQGLLVQN